MLQDQYKRIVGGVKRLAVRIRRDEHGQDLIEYALMAAAIAVAVAAVFPTTINPSISMIFSKVSSTLVASSAAGS